MPSWLKRLQIIDSTTITLFSNLIFKGVGRHPKTGKKKGGIKVHANIHADEGVPSDIRLTSVATNDSFMLRSSNYACGDIVALGRAYIDYAKFEELSRREVTRRSWSFSGLATMFRIMLMYYVNCYTFLEQPEKDCLKIHEEASPPPDEPSLLHK